MEPHVAVQPEVHDSIREMRIDILRLDGPGAKIIGKSKGAIVNRRIQTGGKIGQPFLKIV
jgi:hypothetical protein